MFPFQLCQLYTVIAHYVTIPNTMYLDNTNLNED